MTQTTDTSVARRIPGPAQGGAADGLYADLGGCGARFMIWGEVGRGLAGGAPDPAPLAVRPAAPADGVDEWSYVLEGRMGALLATT